MKINDIEWGDIRVFLAAYRGRSVRSAAKSLNVSHSTVSRRISSLEQQLGHKIFTRKQDGLLLTEMGEALIDRAERIESEFLSMQREVFGKSTTLAGVIRISTIPHIAQGLLIPIIKAFYDLYPEVDIQISTSYQMANLTRHDADVVIRLQQQPDEYLIGRKLPDIASAVYATPEYISRHSFEGKNPTAKWLSWIENSKEMTKWHDRTPFHRCKIQHQIFDPFTHLSAVKAGLGCAILFCFIGDNEPSLQRLKGQPELQSSPCWILTHPDVYRTERVRVFVRFLRETMYKQEAVLAGKQHID